VTRVVAGLAAFTLALLTGCDPCGLALGCAQSPRAALIGQMLDEVTGRPAGGVRVELRRQGGVALDPDVLTTTTGADGFFQFDTKAADGTEATVRMTIAAPGYPSYEVSDVRLRATVKTGEATILAPWSTGRPTLPYVVELYLNGTNDERVQNTLVEFRRTAGPIVLSGDTPVPVIQKTTSDAGWVYFFRELTADRAGDVVGDIIVHLPAPEPPFVIRGASFPAVPQFRPADLLARVGVGSP